MVIYLTDSLTRDAILDSLCLGDLLEAFVEKVQAVFFLILAILTAESIIRIFGWTLFFKSHYTKGTAIKQIENLQSTKSQRTNEC